MCIKHIGACVRRHNGRTQLRGQDASLYFCTQLPNLYKLAQVAFSGFATDNLFTDVPAQPLQHTDVCGPGRQVCALTVMALALVATGPRAAYVLLQCKNVLL